MRSEAKNTLKQSLNHYFGILEGKRLSNSRVSSLIPAHPGNNLDNMWKEHEKIRSEYSQLYTELFQKKTINKPEFSYMDLKVEIAHNIIRNCILCERRCEVNRNFEKGICGVREARIHSEFLHIGEETPLIPSHTIFFAGCNLQCVYCQNWDISQNPENGMIISEENVAQIIRRRKKQNSRNVNFVGGDPTPNLPFILKTMLLSEVNIPLVWNSNFYMSLESMKLLDGVTDLSLTDFKYGNDDCALRLSNAPNYWETVTRNHKMAWNRGSMIIRHLVLPNHVDCCTKPILDWIYSNLSETVTLNIMGQYRPVYDARSYVDISRFLHASELDESLRYARKLGFINII